MSAAAGSALQTGGDVSDIMHRVMSNRDYEKYDEDINVSKWLRNLPPADVGCDQDSWQPSKARIPNTGIDVSVPTIKTRNDMSGCYGLILVDRKFKGKTVDHEISELQRCTKCATESLQISGSNEIRLCTDHFNHFRTLSVIKNNFKRSDIVQVAWELINHESFNLHLDKAETIIRQLNQYISIRTQLELVFFRDRPDTDTHWQFVRFLNRLRRVLVHKTKRAEKEIRAAEQILEIESAKVWISELVVESQRLIDGTTDMVQQLDRINPHNFQGANSYELSQLKSTMESHRRSWSANSEVVRAEEMSVVAALASARQFQSQIIAWTSKESVDRAIYNLTSTVATVTRSVARAVQAREEIQEKVTQAAIVLDKARQIVELQAIRDRQEQKGPDVDDGADGVQERKGGDESVQDEDLDLEERRALVRAQKAEAKRQKKMSKKADEDSKLQERQQLESAKAQSALQEQPADATRPDDPLSMDAISRSLASIDRGAAAGAGADDVLHTDRVQSSTIETVIQIHEIRTRLDVLHIMKQELEHALNTFLSADLIGAPFDWQSIKDSLSGSRIIRAIDDAISSERRYIDKINLQSKKQMVSGVLASCESLRVSRRNLINFCRSYSFLKNRPTMFLSELTGVGSDITMRRGASLQDIARAMMSIFATRPGIETAFDCNVKEVVEGFIATNDHIDALATFGDSQSMSLNHDTILNNMRKSLIANSVKLEVMHLLPLYDFDHDTEEKLDDMRNEFDLSGTIVNAKLDADESSRSGTVVITCTTCTNYIPTTGQVFIRSETRSGKLHLTHRKFIVKRVQPIMRPKKKIVIYFDANAEYIPQNWDRDTDYSFVVHEVVIPEESRALDAAFHLDSWTKAFDSHLDHQSYTSYLSNKHALDIHSARCFKHFRALQFTATVKQDGSLELERTMSEIERKWPTYGEKLIGRIPVRDRQGNVVHRAYHFDVKEISRRNRIVEPTEDRKMTFDKDIPGVVFSADTYCNAFLAIYNALQVVERALNISSLRHDSRIVQIKEPIEWSSVLPRKNIQYSIPVVEPYWPTELGHRVIETSQDITEVGQVHRDALATILSKINSRSDMTTTSKQLYNILVSPMSLTNNDCMIYREGYYYIAVDRFSAEYSGSGVITSPSGYLPHHEAVLSSTLEGFPKTYTVVDVIDVTFTISGLITRTIEPGTYDFNVLERFDTVMESERLAYIHLLFLICGEKVTANHQPLIDELSLDIVDRYNRSSLGRTDCNSSGIPINCATLMTIMHNPDAQYDLKYISQLINCSAHERLTQMCTYAAIIILSANMSTYRNERTRSAMRFPINMILSVQQYIESYTSITRVTLTLLVLLSSQLLILAMIYHILSSTSAYNADVNYPQVKVYISTLLRILNLSQDYTQDKDLIYRLFQAPRESRSVDIVFTKICRSIGVQVSETV